MASDIPQEQRFVPHNPPTHGDTAEHTYSLSDGGTFVVLGPRAEINAAQAHQGLFHEGTRHLSCLRLSLDGRAPISLWEGTVEDDSCVVAVMTNAPLRHDTQAETESALHIVRRVGVRGSSLYERLEIMSYALEKVRLRLVYGFDADFVDLFEVRGVSRTRRGTRDVEVVGRDRTVLRYRGLDGRVRRTRFDFHPTPDTLRHDHAIYEVELRPRGQVNLELSVFCDREEHLEPHLGFEQAIGELRHDRAPSKLGSLVRADDPRLDGWLQRSRADLLLLRTDGPAGPFCQAGLPWFASLFGRDGLITAWQVLWLAPELAAGTLRSVAAHQATGHDPDRDAEPGKIPHELRAGEMAALGEVPFGAYYGSADATLLFLILADAYVFRTGDLAFMHELWPAIEAALSWLVDHADRDGDGFIEHARSSHGLVNQGWKDSPDAIVHADGSLPVGPIALAEVQGYAFAAHLAVARMSERMGRSAKAEELRHSADALRARFEASFWSDSLGTYVLALDGHKAPCRVKASNAGHCLWTRIADPVRAQKVIDGLMQPDVFTGWGIRTLSSRETAFNPMSYHRGSVWPHDCSLIAAGMAAYGRQDAAIAVLQGLLDASDYFERRRMPELFCGFSRVEGEPPTPHPTACAPQAWAAGAGLSLVASALGLRIDGAAGRIWLRNPTLPRGVEEMEIVGLAVGDAQVDLHVHRHRGNVGVSIGRSTGEAELIVVP